MSSNNITSQGFMSLFDTLLGNNTLVSLNLSSKDTINKNKLGHNGAIALSHLLENNRMIQILNLSMMSIQNEDIKIIAKSIENSTGLISLNLNLNDLKHGSMSSICNLLYHNSLEKIDISYNKIFTKQSMLMFCRTLRNSE